MIDTLAIWHRLVHGRDVRGLAALLADTVVFHSPVVYTLCACVDIANPPLRLVPIHCRRHAAIVEVQ